MPLSNEQMSELLRLIGITASEEIDCEECLSHIAEFAEHQSGNESTKQRLRDVEQHLKVCAECQEEYETLRRILDGSTEL